MILTTPVPNAVKDCLLRLGNVIYAIRSHEIIQNGSKHGFGTHPATYIHLKAFLPVLDLSNKTKTCGPGMNSILI